jgi:DNA-binding helix-hairpin-helix protein with protein kinase domain
LQVHLGREVARGGEGAIYAIRDQANLVAKIYHRPPSVPKQVKLIAMVLSRSERLATLAAWPSDVLLERPGGQVMGFVMPRVSGGKPVHQLYGPRSRLVEFPSADWRFLVHAASNIARAVVVVHEHGHVIGDINHGGVLISHDATVRLIDCDSFQIVCNGRRYPCDVGVPDFTPPELHGQSLTGVVRTPNHDAFGLGVLIFQLLFMARHPYSGTYRQGVEDMPLAQAIKEHRFAYGRDAARYQMQPPPGAPPLAVASAGVASLFERAFGPGGDRGDRPTPLEWVTALTELSRSLRGCSINAAHYYTSELRACPWCAIENNTGAQLFGVVVRVTQQPRGTFSIEVIWTQICAVRSPGAAPPLSSTSTIGATPSGDLLARRRAHRLHLYVAIAVALALTIASALFLGGSAITLPVFLVSVVAAWFYVAKMAPADPLPNVQAALKDAKSRWDGLEQRWKTEAGEARFQAKRQVLTQTRSNYLGLAAERQRMIQAELANLEARQRERHLERHRLMHASISGIGPSRKATLLSYGVETAADITPGTLYSIPGFGPVLANQLLNWRRNVEASFRFNASRGIDPADQAAIDRAIAAKRLELERELLAGPAALEQLRRQALAARTALRPAVDEALAALAQAEANMRALG